MVSVAKQVSSSSGGARQSKVSIPRVSEDAVAIIASALAGIVIGAAVLSKPLAALLPVVVLGGILLLIDGRARILFLVFGGLVTLQSSDSLGGLKLLYVAGVVTSCGGALFEFSRSQDWLTRKRAIPLLRVSATMSALILISLFVSRGHGVARTDWLRDVAPYLLFALAPLFAVDAQSAFSRKALVRLLVTSGLVATVAFATHWVEQRQIAELPLSQFALSSFLLPAALFAYATATALQVGQRRARWVLLAVLIFTLLILTGTRSTMILALAPIVAVIAARRQRSARFMRLAVVGPVVLVLMVASAYGVLMVTHASSTVLGNRISILKHTGTSSDASYLDRRAQTHAAEKIFSAHPIFGAGPGTYFNWTVTNGEERSAFIIDSPMSFPAKYGVVGLAVIVFIALSYMRFFRTAFRSNHPRPETLALTAYAIITVASVFLGNPLEDKGWSLGLVLLLALVFRTWDAPVGPAADVRPSTAAA